MISFVKTWLGWIKCEFLVSVSCSDDETNNSCFLRCVEWDKRFKFKPLGCPVLDNTLTRVGRDWLTIDVDGDDNVGVDNAILVVIVVVSGDDEDGIVVVTVVTEALEWTTRSCECSVALNRNDGKLILKFEWFLLCIFDDCSDDDWPIVLVPPDE